MTSGRLEQIWTKRFHRGPMDAIPRADLRAGVGLVDNADQGGARQVAIVSKERWAAVADALGATVDPVLRRANLLVSGIDLCDTCGRVLRVGPCRLRIRGETRPFERMDEVAAPTPKWSMAVRSASRMKCAGNPRAPARETRAARHRSASALAAKTKSLSVRPLILWVQIVTFALPQVRKMSG